MIPDALGAVLVVVAFLLGLLGGPIRRRAGHRPTVATPGPHRPPSTPPAVPPRHVVVLVALNHGRAARYRREAMIDPRQCVVVTPEDTTSIRGRILAVPDRIVLVDTAAFTEHVQSMISASTASVHGPRVPLVEVAAP